MLGDVADVPVEPNAGADRRAHQLAAGGGLTFVVCYLAHRLLQVPGPVDGSAAAVAADLVEHRDRLLAGEICSGLGLLGFVVFLAALLTVLRRAGVRTAHCVVLVAGSVFVALGYVSTAAETALVHLAATEDLTAIRVLFELQARIPVVFAAAAFTAATAIAGGTARLLSRPVAAAGLALAAVFAVGAVLSVVGPAAGEGSPIGPVLFLAWMLTLSLGVHRHHPSLP
jgi:hypothetical protein